MVTATIGRDEAKDVLVGWITTKQGVKATELAAIPQVAMLGYEIPELLAELVASKDIIEVEYTLPQLEWRAKSFYLPAGSIIRVIP